MVFGDQLVAAQPDDAEMNSQTAAVGYPIMSKYLAGELEGKCVCLANPVVHDTKVTAVNLYTDL